MRIAKHGVTGNREHAHALPADVTTAARLTALPEDELQAAIERGDVHPHMRRQDVQALLGDDRDPPSDEDVLARLLGSVRNRLSSFVGEHPELVDEIGARVRAMLREVKRAAAEGGA